MKKENKYRSKYCGDLSKEDIGKVVRIAGWVENIRDHGGIVFVDIRDESGVIQTVSDDNNMFSKLNKESLISSEIAITIKVNDPENDPITYSISFVSDGRERALVNDINLTGDTINYTYTCYAYEQDECYFIVKVNDSFGIVELESEKFAVIKEEGVVTPPKHEHVACPECGKCTAEECDGDASEKCEGHETKTPSTGGMACSMTSVRFISIVISITTLFSLVFRKRD